jgi:hypothetical protein
LVGNNPDIHQECVSTRITTITKRIASNLKTYYTISKSVIGDKEGGKGDLFSIVKAAVALDLLFWQQKARFEFQASYPTLGNEERAVTFDPSWMKVDLVEVSEEKLWRKQAAVSIFCAPALYKYGTTDGNDYGNYSVICKAVVDCLSSRT